MNKIDQIIKAKKFLVEKGYNLNDTLKPLKVAELIIDYHEKKSICNCDKQEQDLTGYDIKHLKNDIYQVVSKDGGTVWKQGTLEELNDYVMSQKLFRTTNRDMNSKKINK